MPPWISSVPFGGSYLPGGGRSMGTLKRSFSLILCMFFLLSGGAIAEAAGAYPSKVITWVSPFAAGGGNDRWSRIMSSAAFDAFGQPWHVRNVPGASGVVGWRWLLRRPADGYTIILGASTPMIGLLMEDKPPISLNDIKIVSYVSFFRGVMVAQPGQPWSNWKGFKEYAKKNPKKITVGGSFSNIIGVVYMFDQAGLDVTYVPYPSTGKAVADFLGGHIKTLVASVSTVKSFIPEKASPVVNTSDLPINKKKFKMFRGVPNAKDLGYDGLSFPRWVGVHPDTPDSIANSISEKMGALLKSKSIKRLIGKIGEEIIYLPRDKAEKEYKRTIEIMSKAVKIMKKQQ